MAGIAGTFPDTDIPTLAYGYSFSQPAGGLAIAGVASLSVTFAAGTNGTVVATVTYMLPQQYVPHTLNAQEITQSGSYFAFSSLLPISGTWTVPLVLVPGSRLIVLPGGCFDDVLRSPTNGTGLSVIVPSVQSLEAVASLETPGYDPTQYTKAVTGGSARMRVPLGTVFTIGLRKPQPAPNAAIPVIAAYTVGTATVKPLAAPLASATVTPKAVMLFRNQSLLQVDDDNAAAAKRFIAVHLGTSDVVLLPLTTNDPPQHISVEVTAPKALGKTQNSWDEYFTNVAHNTGIAPQYLKGQARQEQFGSHLREDNYRYEPCGADLRYVSGGARLAYTNADFSAFRLDDAIGVTLHPGAQDELDPRSRYFIVRTDPTTGAPVDRRISDDDRNVTAREIWDDNNSVTTATPGHTIRWFFNTGCRASDLRLINAPNSTTLDFVAQTPTAASYGMLQVMWEEAVNPRFWNGVDVGGQQGVRAPKYLFDRTEYINIGGGTVQLGANKDATNWPGSAGDKFSSMKEFEDNVNRMMLRYNPAWVGANGVRYGQAVVGYSRSYPPAQPSTVFQ